jgi:hypothetical protein
MLLESQSVAVKALRSAADKAPWFGFDCTSRKTELTTSPQGYGSYGF